MREHITPGRHQSSRRSDADTAAEDEEAVQARRPRSDVSHSPGPGEVVGLQRTFGNHAVQRWLADVQAAPPGRTYNMSNSQPFVASIRCVDDDAGPEDKEDKPVDPAAVVDALSTSRA